MVRIFLLRLLLTRGEIASIAGAVEGAETANEEYYTSRDELERWNRELDPARDLVDRLDPENRPKMLRDWYGEGRKTR